MLSIIVDIVVYLSELLLAYSFISHNYERKTKTVNTFLIGGLLFFIGAIIFKYVGNEYINVIVNFLIVLFFFEICFRIKWIEAIIYSIMLDVIMTVCEMIVIYSISTIFHTEINLHKENLAYFTILAIISKILNLIVIQLFAIFIGHITKTNTYSIRYTPLFIFPIISIVICALFLEMTSNYENSNRYSISILVVSIVMLITSIGIFIYYQNLAENEAKVKELENEQQFYNLNNAYLEVLQHQNDELQMHFHDTKNHYLTISGFEDISEVKDYISKIYKDLDSKTIVNVSSNKIINLILSKYIVLCNKQGIKLSYELQTANLSYIDDSELSIILNNIMDNAVEAASQSEEKQIELSIRHINNMDLLSVINSCDTPPNVKGNRLITTKKDSNGHGFGTRIIKKHAALNNATYEWFYDEDEKQFHTNLIFNPNR